MFPIFLCEQLASQADFWDYMRDTAIPKMFHEKSYNGKKASKEQHQFLRNGYSKRLGAPGLRQFRVKSQKLILYLNK